MKNSCPQRDFRLLDLRSNELSYSGIDCRYVKVNDLHTPYVYHVFKQVQNRNEINFDLKLDLYDKNNLQIYSR